MDLGKFVGKIKDLKKDFDNFLDPVKDAKSKAEAAAAEAEKAQHAPEPEPVRHPKSPPNDHESYLAELFAQKQERIDSQEFLNRLHLAGRVKHKDIEVIDVMRLRMDQIHALKAYCGYSPNHDLTIQIKYARSQAQKDVHKHYAIEIV